MRKTYCEILKKWFRINLIQYRDAAKITQREMAEKLAMDERSYADLEHGKTCCSAVTLVLYLVICCEDPLESLKELYYIFKTNIREAA